MSRDSSHQGSRGSFMARTEHRDTLVMTIAGIWMGMSAYSFVVALPSHQALFGCSASPQILHSLSMEVMFTEGVSSWRATSSGSKHHPESAKLNSKTAATYSLWVSR